MKSHSGETNETESKSVANNIAQKKSNASTSTLQTMANNSPQVQQLKTYQAMADSSKPIQKKLKAPVPLVANSPMASTVAQLAKLPNLKTGGPEFYMREGLMGPDFKTNHRLESMADFTTAEAKKRGIARGRERKNSIVKMDTDDIRHELKKLIREVDNDDFVNGSQMGGNTSKAYPWITSVKGVGGTYTYEGGETILQLGLRKQKNSLLINHLDSGPLDNDPTWIAAKIAEEAAEAAAAAEEEKKRGEGDDEEEDEDEDEGGGGGGGEAVDADAAKKKRDKKKAKKARQKANKAAKATGGAGV